MYSQFMMHGQKKTLNYPPASLPPGKESLVPITRK